MGGGAVAPRGLGVTAQRGQGQASFKASRHGRTMSCDIDAGNRPSDTTAELDRVGALTLIQMPDRKEGADQLKPELEEGRVLGQ